MRELRAAAQAHNIRWGDFKRECKGNRTQDRLVTERGLWEGIYSGLSSGNGWARQQVPKWEARPV